MAPLGCCQEEPNQLPEHSSRSGAKLPGDPRPKLSATRALSHEYVHSYFINDAPSEEVPKVVARTSNPDVSGFVSQACKSPCRSNSPGDETLVGALKGLRSSESRR
jgi:hypothetical protein